MYNLDEKTNLLHVRKQGNCCISIKFSVDRILNLNKLEAKSIEDN